MHDIRFMRDNAEAFDRALARRGLAPEAANLIALDERRRHAIQRFEQAQARRNAASKEIGQAKAKKDEATAAAADGGSVRIEVDDPERSRRRCARPRRH